MTIKIASYHAALEIHAQEKRAEYLVETYGTEEGYLPEPYLHAFHDLEMEKEAILTAVGKGITGGIYRAGKAIGGQGAQRGAGAGIGGKMMDWASRTGGKGFDPAAAGKLKAIGGAGIGTAGLAAFGAGRASK